MSVALILCCALFCGAAGQALARSVDQLSRDGREVTDLGDRLGLLKEKAMAGVDGEDLSRKLRQLVKSSIPRITPNARTPNIG